MQGVRRIGVIVLQLAAGSFVGMYAAMLSWMVLSRAAEVGFAPGLISGAIIVCGCVIGIGGIFGLCGDWRMVIVAALIGVVLTLLAMRLPTIQALGYGQEPLIEVIPSVLATVAYHVTGQAPTTASAASSDQSEGGG